MIATLSKETMRGILSPGHVDGGPENPAIHNPLRLGNRVIMEVVGPDGQIKQRIDHRQNVMATHGLNRLIEMLATDAGGASDWVSAMGLGTSTTAAASTQDALVASTAIKHLSQASMVATDGGNLTLQYEATFDDGSAYECHEVGIFCTNNLTANMAARSVLGASSINKQAADTINVTYQVIASTA